MRLVLLSLAFAAAALCTGAASAQDDDSEQFVRLNRLEGVVRQLSGQVEQLGFENRQLKEQLRKFQEDVEFRFQERSGGRAAPSSSPAPTAAPAATPRPARRSDAFDPDVSPGAPGAPRALGNTGALPARGGDGIASLIDGERPGATPRVSAPPAIPSDVSGLNPAFGASPSARTPGGAASAESARADYDSAYSMLQARRYEEAEAGFRRFLQAHSRDRLAADATFFLGESYLGRSRPREAAEQFLKVSTDFTRSARAPEALLKLGTSLAALGAKDQACATFAELERKYPNAAASVKQGVDREQKRVRCAA